MLSVHGGRSGGRGRGKTRVVWSGHRGRVEDVFEDSRILKQRTSSPRTQFCLAVRRARRPTHGSKPFLCVCRAGVNKLLIDWLAAPDLDVLLQERIARLLQVRPPTPERDTLESTLPRMFFWVPKR